MNNQSLKAMTKEELRALYSELTDFALDLYKEKIELYVWKGSHVTITIFKHLPDKYKELLPFKTTQFNDFYLCGIHSTSDVLLFIINKIEFINLLLGDTKLKH